MTYLTRTVGISEINILHDAYVSIEVIDYAAALLQSRSYGKREISSDFGIVISGVSPSLVLAFSHQTKMAAPMKADDSEYSN